MPRETQPEPLALGIVRAAYEGQTTLPRKASPNLKVPATKAILESKPQLAHTLSSGRSLHHLCSPSPVQQVLEKARLQQPETGTVGSSQGPRGTWQFCSMGPLNFASMPRPRSLSVHSSHQLTDSLKSTVLARSDSLLGESGLGMPQAQGDNIHTYIHAYI